MGETRPLDAVQQILRARAAALATWRPEAQSTARELDYVVFSIGRERWGIGLQWVREVVAPPQVLPIPRTPTFVRGVFVHRGAVLSVLDLGEFLGIPGRQDRVAAALVLAVAGLELAVVVEELHGHESISPAELDLSAATAATLTDGRQHLPLLGVTPDRVALLDGARLMALPELIVDQSA